MALSVQTLHRAGVEGELSPIHEFGDVKFVPFKITLSGNYSTGGDSMDLREFLSRTGKGAVLIVVVNQVAGYQFDYDYTNRKLIIRQGDNDNAADAPGAQLAAAAYPAALTSAEIRGFVFGR